VYDLNKKELCKKICEINRAIMFHSKEFTPKELSFLEQKRKRIIDYINVSVDRAIGHNNKKGGM